MQEAKQRLTVANHTETNAYPVPLWNGEIEPCRNKVHVIHWHNIWICCGRSSRGTVYDIMRQTKNKYHYAVRKVKRSEENIQKRGLLSEIESCNVKEFWSKVRKFGGSRSNNISNVTDCKSNPVDICNVFSDMFFAIVTKFNTRYKYSQKI